jgi:hypothetical protein
MLRLHDFPATFKQSIRPDVSDDFESNFHATIPWSLFAFRSNNSFDDAGFAESENSSREQADYAKANEQQQKQGKCYSSRNLASYASENPDIDAQAKGRHRNDG